MVEYTLEEYGVSSFKWAIAGRSQAKLETVKRELAAQYPDAGVRALGGKEKRSVCMPVDTRTRENERPRPLTRRLSICLEQKVATLVGDSQDEAFLASLAQRTKVVVTTVGPYAKVSE